MKTNPPPEQGEAVATWDLVLDERGRGRCAWIDERLILDPIFIGPTAVVRVTPEKREAFTRDLR